MLPDMLFEKGPILLLKVRQGLKEPVFEEMLAVLVSSIEEVSVCQMNQLSGVIPVQVSRKVPVLLLIDPGNRPQVRRNMVEFCRLVKD